MLLVGRAKLNKVWVLHGARDSNAADFVVEGNA